MISFTLPNPDRRLSPNARSHPMTLANARKVARLCGRTAGIIAKAEARAAIRLPIDPFEIRYTFRYADRRRRDLDNLIASMKSYLDGIVDSGIVGDDSRCVSVTGIYEGGVDRADAVTLVEISPATAR